MWTRAFQVLADVVVVLHLAWILFLVFGAVLGVRWRLARWAHLGALGFAAGLTAAGGICPLTHLEVWLRDRASLGGYAGTFVGHYAERLVYLEVPREVVLAGVGIVAAVSIAAYAWRRTERRT